MALSSMTSEGELSIFICGALKIIKNIIINRELETICNKESILPIKFSISPAEFLHAISNMWTRSDACLRAETDNFHDIPYI